MINMKDNGSIIYILGKKVLSLLTTISPKLATKAIYYYHVRTKLNLKNPVTFDEKLNYLKLYVNVKNPLVTICADKVAVRDYVKEKGCEKILNEVIGIYDRVEDIEWEKLPNKFVIKCNHGSGFNIICKDKQQLDIESCKRKLNKWLKINYGKYTTEIHYSKIKPKIIIEKFIESTSKTGLDDYRIFCYNGIPKYIKVTPEVEETAYYNFYDLNWNKMNFVKKEYESKYEIKKPKNLQKMLKYAEILSENFQFVRVDLYNVDGKIYFAELTFTPTGGCCNKFTKEGALALGEDIILDKKGK